MQTLPFLLSKSKLKRLKKQLLSLQGVVAYWPLDEVSGTDIFDLGPNKYNGVINGNPLQNQPGQIGTSIKFDGTGDYIQVPNFNIQYPFSIAFLYNKQANVDDDRIFDTADAGPSAGFDIRQKTGAENINTWNGVSTTSAVPFGATSLNTWYMLSASLKATSVRTFKNGVQQNEDTSANMTVPANGLTMGRRKTGASDVSATIQHTIVFNRYLTDPEHLALAKMFGF